MKLDGEIRALEDRFGCSPAARLRLGIRFGQAARTLEDLARGLDGPSKLDALRAQARERYRNLRVTTLDPDPRERLRATDPDPAS